MLTIPRVPTCEARSAQRRLLNTHTAFFRLWSCRVTAVWRLNWCTICWPSSSAWYLVSPYSGQFLESHALLLTCKALLSTHFDYYHHRGPSHCKVPYPPSPLIFKARTLNQQERSQQRQAVVPTPRSVGKVSKREAGVPSRPLIFLALHKHVFLLRWSEVYRQQLGIFTYEIHTEVCSSIVELWKVGPTGSG